MKKIYYILSFLILLTSCQKRHPALFQDVTGVYFNNTYG